MPHFNRADYQKVYDFAWKIYFASNTHIYQEREAVEIMKLCIAAIGQQSDFPKGELPQRRTLSMPTKVLYHGRNTTDHTVTLSIFGQRYEYWLTPQACDTVEYLCRHVSHLKALVYAKRHATKMEHLP